MLLYNVNVYICYCFHSKVICCTFVVWYKINYIQHYTDYNFNIVFFYQLMFEWP